MACAIAVMAKVPHPGRSKTRLVPPFSPENAAALSAAFLRDMTENLRILSESVPIAPYVAYAPAGAESHFGTTLAPGTNLLLADGRADIPATVAGFGRWHGKLSSLAAQAVRLHAEPWERLEAVVAAHLRTILDQSDYARVMTQVMPEHVEGVADELRALRERYEERFRALIPSLQLPTQTDLRLFRLLLLGAINWTPVWYRQGYGNVDDVAHAFVAMLRR